MCLILSRLHHACAGVTDLPCGRGLLGGCVVKGWLCGVMGGVYGTWVVVWCLNWLGVISREGTGWEFLCGMLCARWGGGRAGSEYVGVVLWFVMGVMSICCVYGAHGLKNN